MIAIHLATLAVLIGVLALMLGRRVLEALRDLASPQDIAPPHDPDRVK